MGIQIGVLNVRRSILIQASPAEVWREFESFDRIAAWLGRGHVLHALEPKLGGHVDLSVEIDGERRHYGGRVLVWEPGRELTFENNWAAPHAWPVPTLWTLRLTPMYDGTQVELFHHGFERLGADAADNLEGYEEGWDVKHLKALRAIVEH
jgi:uncharacterized protein YndB with AHSA1/START domain